MNWFTSPLAATVVVCAVLAGLAIPLRKLTSDRAVAAMPAAGSATAADGGAHEFAVRMQLRLLVDAASFELSTPDGTVVWKGKDIEAGEHEHMVSMPLHDHRVELLIDADFGDSLIDTALFITLAPDGLDEQTRYAIGAGRIEELLDFHWTVQH